jgi:hypothetical protein
MAGGGGANAALPSNPVPVARLLQSSGYFETKEYGTISQKLRQVMR